MKKSRKIQRNDFLDAIVELVPNLKQDEKKQLTKQFKTDEKNILDISDLLEES